MIIIIIDHILVIISMFSVIVTKIIYLAVLDIVISIEFHKSFSH